MRCNQLVEKYDERRVGKVDCFLCCVIIIIYIKTL